MNKQETLLKWKFCLRPEKYNELCLEKLFNDIDAADDRKPLLIALYTVDKPNDIDDRNEDIEDRPYPEQEEQESS